MSRPFHERTAQGQADVLCACMLIAGVQRKNWVDGGTFTVDGDRAYASLALMAAADEVQPTSRETAVREAITMMGAYDALEEEDYEIMTTLLAKIYDDEFEWPA